MSAAPDRTLKAYANRLANLSGQNKALLFMRPSAQQDMDLLDLDFATGKPALHILEELVEGKSKIALCSTGLAGGADGELSQRLKNISRKALSVAEETGSQDLHIGWPLATGRWANDGLVRAPLMLFPVRLWQMAGMWYLGPQEDESPAFNKAFLLGLAHYNQIQLPPDLLEEDFEDAPTDFLAFRTWLYERLKVAELPIHFNQDLILAPLQKLRSFRKEELLKETSIGAIKLMPEAVLGLFPQADSFMSGDYEQFEELATPLEHILTRRGPEFDTPHPAWPLAVDGSQEVLLTRMRAGESLCVQGPPGTGKSQLIANVTADALAAGKRVLVVCQKRAALDVVQNRLAEVGLGAWLAPVHDFRGDRAALYERIAAQLAVLPELTARAATLRQAAPPDAFARTAARLAEVDVDLETFRTALFEVGPSGLPARTLYLEYQPALPRVDVQKVFELFPFPQAEGYIRKLEQLDLLRTSMKELPSFWSHRKSLHAAGPGDLSTINTLLQAWPTHKRNLEDAAAKSRVSPKEARRWLVRFSQSGFLAGMSKASTVCGDAEVADWARILISTAKPGLIRRLSKKVSRLRRDRPYAKAISQKTVDAALSQMVRPDTKALLKCVDEALTADAKGMATRWLYRTFNPASQAVSILSAGAGTRTERLTRSREGLAAHILLQSFRKTASGRLPSLGLLLPANMADAKAWQRGLDILHQALAVARFFRKAKLGKSVQKVFFADSLTRKAYVSRIAALGETTSAWTKEARARLTIPQIHQLLQGNTDVVTLVEGINTHFDVLVECDSLTQSLSPPEHVALRSLLSARLQQARAGGMAPLFRNSLLAAWIDRTERETPLLRITTGPLLDQRRQIVLQALAERTNTASAQVLLRLFAEAEAIGADARQMKEVAHQVRKKRQIWSVRKLLESYFEPVSRLLPCWLASPETVSAIMPFSEGLFDLVIFDEASQCFAERGIPAAWRGSQILITGDSRQLPPFDLYRVRFEGQEEEYSVDTEAVSLLDLAALYLPEAGLESHYRSHRPELIEFSNRNFYRGRLQALPHRDAVSETLMAITVTRVENGLWENRQNRPEAEALVTAILTHLRTAPHESLGVVTFNQPQQQLVLDVLEDRAAEQNLHIPPTLFVKNIENVQGDERDRIFFSLGYGPDAEGKVRLQFGSLSMQGGENRLNVAITRAKLGIHIFASVTANDLGRAATTASGARLLADYLAYAEEVSDGKQAYQVLETTPPPAGSLAARLAATDKTLAPAYPYADLTRFAEGHPHALVFTDDAALQAAPSAREYLILRPAHAIRLGWPIEQKWCRG